MWIFLSKTGDMWRSKGMERGRETKKIRRKGVVVWVTAHLDLEEWELGGGLEAHKALLTQPYQQERGISVFAWTHTQPAVQRHRLCLLLFTGHSLLSKAMLDLSSALKLTTVIQQRGIQGEGRIRWSAVLEGWENRTEPSCCQKQVWPNKKKKVAVNARWKHGIPKPHSLQHGNKHPEKEFHCIGSYASTSVWCFLELLGKKKKKKSLSVFSNESTWEERLGFYISSNECEWSCGRHYAKVSWVVAGTLLCSC